MPYKDPERQRKAVREAMRRYIAKKKMLRDQARQEIEELPEEKLKEFKQQFPNVYRYVFGIFVGAI